MKKKIYMGATIFSFFTLISFTFDSTTITWFWEGDNVTPIVIAILTVGFGILWIRESRKIKTNY